MNIISSAWGKFISSQSCLPLSQHLNDVSDCFSALVRLPLMQDRLAVAMGRAPDSVTIERLCVLAWIHDIGKLSAAFQARAFNPSLRAGHTVQGWHIFSRQRQVREALNLPEIETWGMAVDGLRFAALAHHGRPVNGQLISSDAEWLPHNGYDPVAAAAELGAWCRAHHPLAFGPGPDLPETPELQHFFAGLVALADQIGSREDFFPVDRQAHAATPAPEALRRLGLDVSGLRKALTGAGPADLFGWPDQAALHPMQQDLAELPLDIRLTILESETGSGKTEAAFLRFYRLFAEGLVDGMYFALPTRAAASQIHARINRAVQAAFGGECILALPGYLKAGGAQGQALPEYRVQWDDAPDAARREARWAAETPRRFLAAPVAVGTVDQVMLAGLQVKWAHFRAATLARSYLVIDEIHASDSYMSAILSQVVRDHVERGGHALLMSATLGAAARAQILGRGRKAKRIPDYPLISWHDGRQECHRAPEADGRTKTVRVSAEPLMARPEVIAQRALAAAREGARVLVIRNTVDQVVALQRAIEATDPEAPVLMVNGIRAPHHGRFAAEDRQSLDAALEKLMGKGAPSAGRIVCASQTAEQSLDIDADFLISDLCPIDVLLQRIGRLHRHWRNDRPGGSGDARCLVLLPEQLAPSDGLLRFGLGSGHDGRGVYPDLVGLEAVRRMIDGRSVWTIPADNRHLVEAGTDPDTLDRLARELGPDWIAARHAVIGARLAGGQAGRMGLIRREEPFTGTIEDCFPAEEKLMTRIGADRISIPFAPGTTGPFGHPVSCISVPGHWHVEGLADFDGSDWQRDAAGRLILPAAGLIYDRMGLRKAASTG